MQNIATTKNINSNTSCQKTIKMTILNIKKYLLYLISLISISLLAKFINYIIYYDFISHLRDNNYAAFYKPNSPLNVVETVSYFFLFDFYSVIIAAVIFFIFLLITNLKYKKGLYLLIVTPIIEFLMVKFGFFNLITPYIFILLNKVGIEAHAIIICVCLLMIVITVLSSYYLLKTVKLDNNDSGGTG